MNKFISFFIVNIFLFNSVSLAESVTPSPVTTEEKGFSINELALPSEVKDIAKKSGSIYYSPSIKDKVLVPINFWGEIKDTGLHFIPIDTSLIMGISLAGGTSGAADLDKIRLTRTENGKHVKYNFKLTEGGSDETNAFMLKPGDVVFVEKSTFYENRSYYTGMIGIFATLLSSYILIQQIKNTK